MHKCKNKCSFICICVKYELPLCYKTKQNKFNNQIKMDKEQLNTLKKKLPKAWAKTIAKEMGVTPATVTNAMNGKYGRTDIIECAIKLVRETTLATQKNLEEVLNELSEKNN